MKYNVVVIGSGPGGYVAAIRSAQLGMKTALIEKYSALGGTCLNVGCIPSKAMLDSTEHFHKAREQFGEHGIEVSGLKVNLAQMIKRKNEVVKQTCDGVSFLMKKNKIDVYYGTGSFKNKNLVTVTAGDGKINEIEAENVIIATGSKPSALPFITLDKKRVITSTEALELKEVPAHMIIIGGGVIGVEIGSMYARLGSRITVVEFLDALIPAMDRTMGRELQKSLKKLGFEIFLKHKVTEVTAKGKQVTVVAENEKNEKAEWTGDYCLVAIGRKPYTAGLGLEKPGIKTDSQGRIEVDKDLRTNIPNIYAIGDVIRGAMLAHKAEDEGIFAAERIAGRPSRIDYLTIPNVIYTWPEVATVGYTEEELKSNGIHYKTGTFPFKALGRARASMDTEGLVKILSDGSTDEILGIHIIGPRAADMIAEAVVAMEFRASAGDLARISHAHPTFTEAIREASLAATANRAIHL